MVSSGKMKIRVNTKELGHVNINKLKHYFVAHHYVEVHPAIFKGLKIKVT